MTWTNTSKPSSSFSNMSKPGEVGFILTDALDYVLVGQDEDEFLIWSLGGTSYTNLTKPS